MKDGQKGRENRKEDRTEKKIKRKGVMEIRGGTMEHKGKKKTNQG